MNTDFELRLKGYSLVTINVIYFLPDYRNIVNEFIWQTMDVAPKYPRIGKFLNHWQKEIDAVIKEILVSEGGNFEPSKFQKVDVLYKYN